jgi:hypothetical protein
MSIYATLWTLQLSPLLVLTGQEYARMTFDELHDRICDALRGNRAPVVMEAFLPDGTHRVLRQKRPSGNAGTEPTHSAT